MTSDQNNKLAMYGSVEELLKTTTETSGIAGLPAKLTTLTTKLAELRTLAGTQTQPTAGQTASRDQTLANLIDTALEIAGVLGAYAHEHTLRDLSALVDVQRSDFDAVRLIQRPLLAQRVHDAAAGALPSLGDARVRRRAGFFSTTMQAVSMPLQLWQALQNLRVAGQQHARITCTAHRTRQRRGHITQSAGLDEVSHLGGDEQHALHQFWEIQRLRVAAASADRHGRERRDRNG